MILSQHLSTSSKQAKLTLYNKRIIKSIQNGINDCKVTSVGKNGSTSIK
jgi:hypothetical protein